MENNFFKKLYKILSSDKTFEKLNFAVNIVFWLQMGFRLFNKGASAYVGIALYVICIVSNTMYFIRKKRYAEIILFALAFAVIGWWMYKQWLAYSAMT